jgi:hypothetical protein
MVAGTFDAIHDEADDARRVPETKQAYLEAKRADLFDMHDLYGDDDTSTCFQRWISIRLLFLACSECQKAERKCKTPNFGT